MFIKPHAVTEPTKALVKEEFAARGITVVTEGELTSEVIDAKQLIDQHYYAIASKATILKPAQLNVPADKFKAKFGVEWADALASGQVLNAADGCKALGVDSEGLNELWGAASKQKKLVKFGGGFYCGQIDVPGKKPFYIFNAFFMSMRSQFTEPGKSIYYYVVEWDAADLSWDSFRNEVLGPTNPADAPATSLRGMIMDKYQALGLASKPYTGENGVHASASPFEALAERMNWLEAPLAGTCTLLPAVGQLLPRPRWERAATAPTALPPPPLAHRPATRVQPGRRAFTRRWLPCFARALTTLARC